MSVIKVRIVFNSNGVHQRVITGRKVPFTDVKEGDLTSSLRSTEEHLSRILGMTVKIETAE